MYKLTEPLTSVLSVTGRGHVLSAPSPPADRTFHFATTDIPVRELPCHAADPPERPYGWGRGLARHYVQDRRWLGPQPRANHGQEFTLASRTNKAG